MLLEVLPVNKHRRSTTNYFQATHDATQNVYLDSTNASISSHKMSAKIGTYQTFRNESSSSQSSSAQHKRTQHLEELTVINNSHSKIFKISLQTWIQLQWSITTNSYLDMSSPQEDLEVN